MNAWIDHARAVRIENEIERRGIKLRGTVERVGPCPKCGGDDRFSINTNKQVWHCRGCDDGGDVIKLVQHLDGVDFRAACTTLGGEPPPNKDGAQSKEIVAEEYAYRDENGDLVFLVKRIEDRNPDGSYVTKDGKRKKSFRQWRPDPNKPGAWIKNVDGIPPLPYRLPEVIEAVANEQIIVIVEGERKVDLLHSWNVPATCNAGGAKHWKPEHAAPLAGAHVVIIPDNDQAGQEHINVVAQSLEDTAASIRILKLPGLPPKGDIIDWAASGGTVEQLNELIENTSKHWTPPKRLLWRYEAREFSAIPRRRWLHAGHYIRGQVVMSVAPGGWGKTSLVLCNAIEMATGRGLIGPEPLAGPLNVAYWNAEDPDEEIERRIAAVCLRYKIDPATLRERLFLGSRLTGKRRIASLDRSGNVVFDDGLLAEIEQLIIEYHLEAVIFDPLVAFHRVPEGDNMPMEQVIKDGFGEIATRTDCCVELSQHTRKPTQGRAGDLTADDSRGAGAIVNAARSVRVLNRMTAEEAELPKIEPEERRHYLRVSRDKSNLAPPGKAAWIHLLSVELPNGDRMHAGDQVQTVEQWDYPEPLPDVTTGDMKWMRQEVRERAYRANSRSADWVGIPLARRLDLDPSDPSDRKRLNSVLRTWFHNGVLAIEKRKDGIHHEREYVIPGNWHEADDEEQEPLELS